MTAPAAPVVLDVFVPGTARPQGSHRHVGGGRLAESSDVKPWRSAVGWRARSAMRGRPLDGPVSVALSFVLARPRATPRGSTPPAVRRPDLDKLIRAVLDALTMIVYVDDSRVVALTASKVIAEHGQTPGVRVVVARVEAEHGADDDDGAAGAVCARCRRPAARLILGRCEGCAYPAGGGPAADGEGAR